MTVSDLLIIGGGPAGLSAAINGASEGLNVHLLDNGYTLGGQAKESSAIENYPGFPDGVTGEELMNRMARQARKFASGVVTPVSAQRIVSDKGRLLVTTDDYSEFEAKTVLLTLGLQYRRLQAENIGHFVGRGVFYGVPSFVTPKSVRTAGVIGGANSAGQAALGLAASNRLDVKLLIRKTIGVQMSQYLIDRIMAHPRIEVMEFCEVTECHGSECLTRIVGSRAGEVFELMLDNLYIFIGAMPRTLWLRGAVVCDEHNFITTGPWQEWDHSREQGGYPPQLIEHKRLMYETSMRGVFAAGDVRAGSIKRIATGIGEGAGALQMIHSYLGDLSV